MDRTQRGWAIASLVILAVCGVVYAVYAVESPQGPHGGSAIGLAFGIVGFAFMIFAALLGARKRVPVWRLGRAQTWMRGHLWLGLLSLPLILFHGGFHFGGTLTSVLMWLLIITVASGVFGAALQNYIPRTMTADVPLETIYAEIANVRKLLRIEADRTVESVCGSLGFSKESEEETFRAGGFSALRPMAGGGAEVATETVVLTREEREPLRQFYISEMQPYLENPQAGGQRLRDAAKAQAAFSRLRLLLPDAAHSALEDLQDICDEARQLKRQEQLHQWLHGWLLLHIPFSLALILLGAVHVVMALQY